MPGFPANLLKLIVPFAFLLAGATAAFAGVISQQGPSVLEGLNYPVYLWQDDSINPKAVVLAAHGATLHGGAYDTFGRLLASHGYIVIAPDMHGFGHFYHDAKSDDDRRVIYDASESDLVAVLKVVRKKYPDLPVIFAGESTGAQLGVRLAANHPELMDGVILSSGSPHLRFPPVFPTIVDLTKCAFSPRRQVDLSPYIEMRISENPQIAKERITDPLGRNCLSLTQMCKIFWMNRRTMDYAPKMPADLPVLALQGTADHLFKPQDISLLTALMKSQDKTVKWFDKRGHILLETRYLQPDTAETVVSWLDQHTQVSGKRVAVGAAEKDQTLRN